MCEKIKFVMTVIQPIYSHEINFRGINSHVINSYMTNFSHSQLLGNQLS